MAFGYRLRGKQETVAQFNLSSRCKEFNLGSLPRGPVHAGSPARRARGSLRIRPTLAQDVPAPSGQRLGMHLSMVIARSGGEQSLAANGRQREASGDFSALSG